MIRSVCNGVIKYQYYCSTDHLQLRLTGGGDTCAGRLEIYYLGSWGTVCDDSWDLVDAHVVCRQLGCGYALQDKLPGYCGRSSGPVWLDEVRCSGNESCLWECPSAPWGEHDCSHKEDVTVMCSEHKEMRLVNGESRCEGRVEVLYNGTWGTVCSEKLDEKSAEVICKQVKCGHIKFIYPGSREFGKGVGPIWLDEMECFSHESTLWQCHSNPWGKHNCDHTEDAGVVCEDLVLDDLDGTVSKTIDSSDGPFVIDGGTNDILMFKTIVDAAVDNGGEFILFTELSNQNSV
ncbi:deleted in malignant brain tumors 1 protein-like [Pristis pectinata]|uniref:deleted in malignant brain tumors 1 protein-like n=1 Tax=Pristis pectinata TaxID=685728 RepID=UPI00223D1BE0|nr:deleted in malignant brain tumors 1 protein-like [Pristis pectinata]